MKLSLKRKGTQVGTEEISKAFESCLLLTLNVKCWSNTKKVPLAKLSKITNQKLSRRIKSSKSLIDPEKMDKIHSIINRVRNLVKGSSIPFPLEAVYMIPIDYIEPLTEKLDELIDEMDGAIEEFANDYREYISESEDELGEELFNEEDYPRDIETKFSISYKFMEISTPGRLQKISPKQYQEEAKKFQDMLTEARGECIMYLRQGFVKVLEAMITSLSGKDGEGPKKIRTDAMERIEKFFTDFQSKNVFKDNQLEELIQQGRNIMNDIDVKELKESDKLREAIVKQMDNLKGEVQKSVTIYKRRVNF